ncbi:Uncharacterised protein [uncultured archaeon]|nr:Uncharacterised protein [uncultured archaeon]
MAFIKIHKATRYVVAICDEDLLGKKFEDSDGKRQVDLTGNFFKGEVKTEEEIIEAIKDFKREDASFNIIGKESVSYAIKSKLISQDEIIEIAGIPIAMILN